MSFDDNATAGETLVAGSIHSPNFASGSSGWTINRDGSAEFQNVLVRGTITGSTIIGSTIIGGTIIGGDIQSTNYVAGTSGFDLNGNTNQIEINTGFRVGGAAAANVQLSVTGGQPRILFNTAAANQTGVGALFGQAIGATPGLFLLGPTTAQGFGELAYFGASPTNPLSWAFQTSGTTLTNGVRQNILFGGSAGDLTAVTITNTNTVASAGPPLIIGDPFTPGARLFLSANEIVAANAAGALTTLHLNETVGGAARSVSNDVMRAVSSASGGAAAATIAAIGYAPLPAPVTTTVTLPCPASATVVVSWAAQIGQVAATTATDFCVLSVNIANTTQGTTPFAPTDLRAAGGTTGVAGANPTANWSRTIVASGLGLEGDNLVITLQAHVSTINHYTVQRTDLTALPSM